MTVPTSKSSMKSSKSSIYANQHNEETPDVDTTVPVGIDPDYEIVETRAHPRKSGPTGGRTQDTVYSDVPRDPAVPGFTTRGRSATASDVKLENVSQISEKPYENFKLTEDDVKRDGNYENPYEVPIKDETYENFKAVENVSDKQGGHEYTSLKDL